MNNINIILVGSKGYGKSMKLSDIEELEQE